MESYKWSLIKEILICAGRVFELGGMPVDDVHIEISQAPIVRALSRLPDDELYILHAIHCLKQSLEVLAESHYVDENEMSETVMKIYCKLNLPFPFD
jgi:hypothetical protein